MLNLTLSWDLFILVFFTVIIAYSFIIGKNQTLKVIIATYVAILAADGLGNIFEKYLFGQSPVMKLLPADMTDKALIFMKIVVFVVGIVIISVKGGFSVDIDEESSSVIKVITLFIFGFLNAGLIVSTVLVYISGVSFVTGGINVSSAAIVDIYNKSELVKLMINNYNFWFSLPAIAFIFSSLIYVTKK